MTAKVILVTPPDEVLQDGLRLLTINLDSNQKQIISDALSKVEFYSDIIVYLWNSEDLNWLIDKKHKADFIIFNADSENDILNGYFAAQKNSVYFGNLKLLHSVNKSAIYTVDDCVDFLHNVIKKYEQ